MNRQISIDVSAEVSPEVQRALFYLIMWSIGSYDKLTICDDFPGRNHNDMIAHYKNTTNGNAYTIGAIWDKDRKGYSFHS